MKYLLLLLPLFSFAQQTQSVDFKSVSAKLAIDAVEKTVSGSVAYDFEVLRGIDTIKIDAQHMTFKDVKVNNKTIAYLNTAKQLQLIHHFKKGKNTLTFEYAAKPKQTLYFTGSEATSNLQIWTQGQGKYTSHWFPSFDDMNEKVVFNLSVAYDKPYQVISNGVLNSKVANGEKLLWKYTMQHPMSSYLLMVAIGKFDKQVQTANSGIALEMYYRPEDADKFEPTYRYSKQIFDFLEKEIGIPYQWEIYKQVPVRDFLYGGMENTSATVFTQDYVIDAIGFNDRNYININAHELAHQWFGDLITAKSGKDHWLQEGFATYYALLAEQEVFGKDHFNQQMYTIAEQLQRASKTDTIPILNEKASSLSFYQKGAWALHVLREGVGEDKFRQAVKNYLSKYKFTNVDTDNFLAEVNKVSNYDTRSFRKRWLESPRFEVNEALALLKKNAFMKRYFEVSEMKELPFAAKKEELAKILESDAFYPIKEEVIYQLQDVPFDQKAAILRKAMQTNDIHVRQAIAQNITEVPQEFKKDYETFLDDPSYITREIALNVLWSQFADGQKELLDKTKVWVGFNDNNLRILWLAMALSTKDYEVAKKTAFYEELLDYASPKFESTTRQNAIANLMYLNKNDENYLPYIVNGLASHRWQFVKFSRDKIRILLKSKSHRTYFETLLTKIPESEQVQLTKLLKE